VLVTVQITESSGPRSPLYLTMWPGPLAEKLDASALKYPWSETPLIQTRNQSHLHGVQPCIWWESHFMEFFSL